MIAQTIGYMSVIKMTAPVSDDAIDDLPCESDQERKEEQNPLINLPAAHSSSTSALLERSEGLTIYTLLDAHIHSNYSLAQTQPITILLPESKSEIASFGLTSQRLCLCSVTN